MPLEHLPATGIKWKIIGNIPYHITSGIIFKAIEWRQHIDTLTLMVQREVAERIIAQPNSKTYGIPSVLSQLYADVKILFRVSNRVFYPRPKVESAVIQWKFLPESRYPVKDEQLLARVVKTMFGQRRKQIGNSLKAFAIDFDDVQIDPKKRPEQLGLAEIVAMINGISYG